MRQTHLPYTITPSVDVPFKIEYTSDAPNVREWLINLRRDLLRKVKQLDELIAQLPLDK